MIKHHVPLYLVAIAFGATFGLSAPATAASTSPAINPVLMALLYATFLGVPLSDKRARQRLDLRFLAALLTLNFIVVPLVVFVLTRPLAAQPALLTGALFVLLAPCIDYVIVFSAIAGANHAKLIAATPLLMLAQMLLLPIYLQLFSRALIDALDPTPLVHAFLLLIILPLAAAVLTQRFLPGLMPAVDKAMVPLMMLTLFIVVASQIPAVSTELPSLIRVVPIYVLFLLVMAPLGKLISSAFRQVPEDARAITFSGATRNSLVILPMALALPEPLALASVAIVTQTLVELLGMVVYVRVIPRIFPSQSPSAPRV